MEEGEKGKGKAGEDVSSPAPEIEDYRWKEENLDGDSCRGLWMEINSWIGREKGLGGMGLGRLIDMKKMRREQIGVVEVERKMAEVN